MITGHFYPRYIGFNLGFEQPLVPQSEAYASVWDIRSS